MSDKVVTIGGTRFALNVERDGDTFRAGAHEITVVATRGNIAEIHVDGRTVTVPFLLQGTKVSFLLDGETVIAEIAEKGAQARVRHRDHSMSAPMPGVVLKILVQPGQQVTRGTPLVILEAMKMEHVIAASHDGVVQAVNCREGELVQPGVDLIELGP